VIEEAIGLGLVISLIFSETLGLAAGGMVVPGYLALMMHKPLRIVGTLLVGLLTLGVLRLLSRYMLIFGRRRIVVAVLVGFTFGALSRDQLLLQYHEVPIDLRTIGFVIPGLIANWMDRQGVLPTLCVMTTTAVLVRLLLMILSGGNLIQ
jgi:poly-gamma-glutamate biosynthesis protein PgsC/CapC